MSFVDKAPVSAGALRPGTRLSPGRQGTPPRVQDHDRNPLASSCPTRSRSLRIPGDCISPLLQPALPERGARLAASTNEGPFGFTTEARRHRARKEHGPAVVEPPCTLFLARLGEGDSVPLCLRGSIAASFLPAHPPGKLAGMCRLDPHPQRPGVTVTSPLDLLLGVRRGLLLCREPCRELRRQGSRQSSRQSLSDRHGTDPLGCGTGSRTCRCSRPSG